ncbi:Bis-tetraphosphatase [Zopfochytrium polystomum]|nr:Bis-tetraphosphatase [Zopfochytrium polystomum]
MSRIISFGPHKINAADQVFFASRLSLGLVNLKPVAVGHVLIVPRRVVPRFAALSHEEVSDLFLSAHRVAPVVEKVFGGSSLSLTIQDGPLAGQSVPHVHLHIIPRWEGDYWNNDDIYRDIDRREHDLHQHLTAAAPDAQDGRKPRSLEEMAQEARMLRRYFPEALTDCWE